MSCALAPNHPLEIIHLYFDEEQEVLANCLLTTNETVESTLPVFWHHIIQTIGTVVRGPVNMNAGQARDKAR
ncbi:BZ3500_MvSof-1268-A1-R1_Chr2-1g04584 [Microbotryum saponariae]|uniref:BZ3500_MvSof-1268-A1-R1_Chr2-1g04584 protein n=1 Tax=Microbotryum saponariae TaxID=289078 RepID=A0A2X0K959_9BASI|nr:BZ3500_MvSof-1268-A1-R1_Chr2-1g04584 [Microbotryum saponariae]SCZ92091.1 BZ3501_MvSof-1269-A2-R1_Chr2-1g04240 [Microbotryum saponariae]